VTGYGRWQEKKVELNSNFIEIKHWK
jgi:hypothetical protein